MPGNNFLKNFIRRIYQSFLFLFPYKLRMIIEFIRQSGNIPKLKNPNTHTEKLLHRTLNAENSVLGLLSSKTQLKEAIGERLRGLGVKFPELYWFGSGEDLLTEFNDMKLPETWVLKPNNLGGGLVLIGDKKTSQSDIADFVIKSRKVERLFNKTAAVGWRNSIGGFLIEQKIISTEEPLQDYKIHVFDNVPRVLSIYRGRFEKMTNFHYFLPASKLYRHGDNSDWPDLEEIQNIEKIINVSSKLTFGLAYVRIDFYLVKDELWFGEVTPFPSFEGLARRRKIDNMLGRLWQTDLFVYESENQ